MNKKDKSISIRLGDTLTDLIDQYAAFMSSDRSKVIRQGMSEWLFEKTKAAQFQRFEEYLEDREAFTILEKCEKCGSNQNLGLYHIDGNIDNNTSKNLVTICIPCLGKFEKFRLNKNIVEKFIEWFFTES